MPSDLDQALCCRLQQGLPILERPFANIGEELHATEVLIVDRTGALCRTGIIRRIGPVLNYRALGRTATLVMAQVPPDRLKAVIETVNALDGVSHNYLRRHRYNLWFTLQGQDLGEIEQILRGLFKRWGMPFRHMPAVRTFKLDVRFNLTGQPHVPPFAPVPQHQLIELTAQDRLVLSRLQGGLQPVARPFDFLREPGLPTEGALDIVRRLIQEGIIRRLAAVLDHYRLGFKVNCLFVARVEAQHIEQAGLALAGFPLVSHCYQRRSLPDWPYNLYAMIHAPCQEDIQGLIDTFRLDQAVLAWEVLTTERQLKKQPVRLDFGVS